MIESFVKEAAPYVLVAAFLAYLGAVAMFVRYSWEDTVRLILSRSRR